MKPPRTSDEVVNISQQSAHPISERLPTVLLSLSPSDRAPQVAPNFQTTSSSIEGSLLFRVLVQAMFAIGVMSVDSAAGTYYSAISLPVTTIGAVWCWHRRDRLQNWLNTAVSLFGLLLLVCLLVPLLFVQMQTGIEHLRPRVASAPLTLGMLCVSIQIGLSFYLYNRQALGYSMATAGVLMSVAACLSQNIGFLFGLCGFVALAVPALMLDYRSRLALWPIGIALLPTKQQLSYRSLPWKYLTQLGAIAIGLGLVVAVFLPNFHLPDLSFPTGFDRTSSANPASSTPAPTVSNRDIATKILSQPGNDRYPDTITRDSLQLAPTIADSLQQLTRKILATSPQPLGANFDRAVYLAEYLQQHHRVDLQQPAGIQSAPTATLLQQLITTCSPESQNCQIGVDKSDLPVVYTAMLRSIGIPARLKMGNQLAQFDSATQLYSRPPLGSQSQVEVYMPNWGWFGLNSTPDRPAIDPDTTQVAQLQQLYDLELARTPASSSASERTLPSIPRGADDRIQLDGRNLTSPQSSLVVSRPQLPFGFPQWLTDPAILRTIVAVIGIAIGMWWYRRYQRYQQQRLAMLPPVERIYRSMLATLSARATVKLPTQTQLEYAASAGNSYNPQIATVVWEITKAYTAWRYGKQKPNLQELTKKMEYLRHLQQLAAQKQRQQWIDRFKTQLGFPK